ncbi:hypothetical protein V6N12_003265 [Hibiscus sabdariffa]|uniref:Uncharacterized protein n=1 Tax=Hibiscus sabdariffa TaxID=183260 RepID=A0ABR2EBH1_9ROSI
MTDGRSDGGGGFNRQRRPPDVVFDPADPALARNGLPTLEHHGSPLPTEVIPTAKRGRLESEDVTLEIQDDARLGDHYDTTMGDGEDINPLRGVENQAGQGDGQPKPSFRDTLIGKNGLQPSEPKIKELDVMVTDEDVRFGGDSRLPEIRGKEPVVVSTNGARGSKTISQSDGLVNSTRPRELPMDLDAVTDRLVGEEDVELEMGWYKFPKKGVVECCRLHFGGGGSKPQAKMAVKGGRIGAKVKKKDDRGSSKLALEPRMATLVSDLDEAEAAEVDRRKGNQGGDVQWHENGMFNQPRDNLGQV